MSLIELDNVFLSYPIYGSDSRNLKSTLVNFATGGILNKNHQAVHVDALQSISFRLEKGDRLAVIGHNGAGKSSLLKVLAKIYSPTSGSIKIKGTANCLFDIMLGMDPELNGIENIILRSRLAGLSKKEAKGIIAEVESFADLGNFIKMPLKTYSTGMQVRLAFGTITSINSNILLIDEIINVGDSNFIKKAQSKIANLIDASDILVLSSHDEKLLEKFCNKAIWLEHGKVKAFGQIDSVLSLFRTNHLNSDDKRK